MPRDLDPIRALADRGIHLRHGGDRHKLPCPRCQHTRVRHRSDKPLFVLVKPGEGYAIWKCFHCPFRGATHQDRQHEDFDREWTAAGRAARSRQQKFDQGQQWRARFKSGESTDAPQPAPSGYPHSTGAGRRSAGDEWRRKFRNV